MERWFVKREELVLGPYSEDELQGYVARGKVTAADLVSRDGKVGWTTIYQVPQFRDAATHDAVKRVAALPPEPESETPPAASVRAWYVARGSQVAGPLDLDALRAALIQGKLKLDDKVCEVGGTAWGAVNGIAEVADLLPPVPLSGGPSGSSSSAPPITAPVTSSHSQNDLADRQVSSGGAVHSKWRVVGVCLVSVAIVFIVLVGLSPAPETQSTTNTLSVPAHSSPSTMPTRCGESVLFAGFMSTCIQTAAANGLTCWGLTPGEELGTQIERCEFPLSPPLGCHRRPTEVRGIRGVAEVAIGAGFACARLHDKTVWCWGGNRGGQLGNGSGEALRREPQLVSGLSGVEQIAVGLIHACALITDGTVRCWGININGQLGVESIENCGDGTLPYPTACSRTPMEVPGLQNVARLALGSVHSCALLHDGSVRCWGSNQVGQLGAPAPDLCRGPAGGTGEACARAPQTVPGVVDAERLVVGGSIAVAFTRAGNALVWGNDTDHRLFGGQRELHAWAPGPSLEVSHITQLVIGQTAEHACALLDDATVRCWGSNDMGQLGLGGAVASVQAPTIVPGLQDVAELASSDHTCARSCDGTIRCWGANALGQIGDGSTEQRSSPTLVAMAGQH